jgi:hypothetical protein
MVVHLQLLEDTPYYGGLREGLREACNVQLCTTINRSTDEWRGWVERKGEGLWSLTVARIALIEQAALNQVHIDLRDKGNEIVDEILDRVDWDTFFPVAWSVDADGVSTPIGRPVPPEEFAHPYTKIRATPEAEEEIRRLKAANKEIAGYFPNPKGERTFRVE